jgi:hypothetical protein
LIVVKLETNGPRRLVLGPVKIRRAVWPKSGHTTGITLNTKAALLAVTATTHVPEELPLTERFSISAPNLERSNPLL